MMDVSVNIDVEGATSSSNVNRMYPAKFNDLFASEQLVLVGRYRQPGNAKIVVKGKVGGSEQSFDFPGQLVEHSPEQSMAFVEKLWAMRRIGEIIDEIDLKGRNEELIKELVDLSTTHGILTPYTSFLADENRRADLASAERLYLHTEREVRALDQTDGRGGVAQRAEKQYFKDAPLAESGNFGIAGDSTAPASAARPASGAGGGGGFGGGGRRMSSGAMMGGMARNGLNAARYRNIETDEDELAEGVVNIGSQTLYKRGTMWIAANARDVDLEKDKKKLIEIERYTDEYFKLVDDNNAAENLVLSSQADDEQLLIRLRNKVYLIK
jgi:Ca-activated chloride channel family protein